MNPSPVVEALDGSATRRVIGALPSEPRRVAQTESARLPIVSFYESSRIRLCNSTYRALMLFLRKGKDDAGIDPAAILGQRALATEAAKEADYGESATDSRPVQRAVRHDYLLHRINREISCSKGDARSATDHSSSSGWTVRRSGGEWPIELWTVTAIITGHPESSPAFSLRRTI